MVWPIQNPPEDIRNLIYKKQGEFKAEKGRMVSIPYTIYRLLKEAYLLKKEEEAPNNT